MKKSVIILLCMMWASATAQETDQEPELPRDPRAKARIDAARAAYITERLGLTAEEAEQFWPVYREFSARREDLRETYVQARKSGQKEEELVDLGLKLRQRELDLEKDYAGRLMKVISAQKLMDLRTAEREFTRIIIRQLQQRQQQMERRQQLRDRQQERLQQRNN